MALTFTLFALGFVLLVKGADLLVDGSVALAKRLRISNLLIGLTIVSFGTSLPEMVVNLFASASGNTELAVANIIGSNIANIFLILGVAAIIMPLCVPKGTVWREIPYSLFAILLLVLLTNDKFFNDSPINVISTSDGLIMISFLALFMFYIYRLAVTERKKKFVQDQSGLSLIKSLIYLFLGVLGLMLGGDWVVGGAVGVATMLGISTNLIGLTIVAIGTSLPELVTSAVAAYKKNAELAVGNAVGSNIFNILWILGLSAIIRPLPFLASSNFDILVVVIATVLLFIWMFIGKKHTLERWQGVLFLFSYAAYIMLIINRG